MEYQFDDPTDETPPTATDKQIAFLIRHCRMRIDTATRLTRDEAAAIIEEKTREWDRRNASNGEWKSRRQAERRFGWTS